MMEVYIDDFDFYNAPAMKYWAPPKSSNLREMVNNFVSTGNYCLSTKVDGNWMMVIKDMNGKIYTRSRDKSVSGNYLNKIGHIPHLAKYFKNLDNGTVLLGEIYFKGNEGSRKVTTIMGCLQEKAIARQEKGQKLSFYIFDCLATNGEDISFRPLAERVAVAQEIYNYRLKDCEYIDMARYIWKSEEMLDYIGQVLAEGREGVVLQRKDIPYEYGKRTARHTLKVKKEIQNTIDCFFTGRTKPSTWDYQGMKGIEEWKYWFDIKNNKKLEGKYYDFFVEGAGYEPISKGAFYGWPSAIELGVYRDNRVVPICWISNITEAIKKGITEDPDKWLHKVCSITAMMVEEDTKKLRHSKIVNWRPQEDKDWKACDGNEIFGEENE